MEAPEAPKALLRPLERPWGLGKGQAWPGGGTKKKVWQGATERAFKTKLKSLKYETTCSQGFPGVSRGGFRGKRGEMILKEALLEEFGGLRPFEGPGVQRAIFTVS